MPISTGTSSRRNEVIVCGIPFCVIEKALLRQSRNQVLVLIDHGGVQNDFFHLLLEHKHALVVARAGLRRGLLIGRSLIR